jgi:pyruvate dehydrogenase E1 component alpha subunit/2-oxoisovalerate dehydrogenase E1 component alpha subunit
VILEPNATLRDSDPDVGLFTVLREDGSTDPSTDPHVPNEILLSAYRQMRRLRLLDARMILLQRQGRVGFYGACTGQEAVPIATGFVTKKDDWVFPALREQSVMLVRGFPLREFIAQVFGNAGDVQKGRQMPSHQSGRRVNQVSWSSCIGPQVPQAVGAAWAMKLRKEKNITFGFCGDGATSQPDFHTAMHFAATYQAPLVLVCQNNHWSISVPTARQTASRTLAVKARAYGTPSVRVDGNDFLACYKVISDAADRARRGEGPTFIEALTYRIGAHSTSDDPSRYRAEAEVEAWKKKDPVDRLTRHLRHRGLIDDAHEATLEAELTTEIGAAVNEVEAMSSPERRSLFDDVYGAFPRHLEEQREELMAVPPALPHGSGHG